MFTSQFFPAATPEQAHAFNELERASASPPRAAQLVRAFAAIDATDDLAKVRCPTLVMHQRGDARVPFEEGRFVAAGIPGARFEPLHGDSHLPLPGEPAFEQAMALLHDFLPASSVRRTVPSDLESQLLDLLARGLDTDRGPSGPRREDRQEPGVGPARAPGRREPCAGHIVQGREAGYGLGAPR